MATLCTACNGSGEGMTDGSRCYYCKGKGTKCSSQDEDDDDGDEPTYDLLDTDERNI